MPTSPGRFSQLRFLQTMVFVAGVVVALALVLLAVAGLASRPSVWMACAGATLLVAVIIAMSLVPVLLQIESSLVKGMSVLRDVHDLLRTHTGHLEALVENTRISDAAKSLAHRDEELEALRSVIRNDISTDRWEAALTLIDEMEQRFGYKDEADRIREELDDARNSLMQSKLAEAIEVIETHFAAHEWDRAQKEIDRIKTSMPEDTRVQSLLDRMAALKAEHKQELRKEWAEAERRSDTDHAIEVLRELNQYLSPAEAQELRDSARTVFKEKLLLLGVQFRFAVTEKRWQDALSIGLELVRDFPNARMANEVREALDTLRERARQAAETTRPAP